MAWYKKSLSHGRTTISNWDKQLMLKFTGRCSRNITYEWYSKGGKGKIMQILYRKGKVTTNLEPWESSEKREASIE